MPRGVTLLQRLKPGSSLLWPVCNRTRNAGVPTRFGYNLVKMVNDRAVEGVGRTFGSLPILRHRLSGK